MKPTILPSWGPKKAELKDLLDKVDIQNAMRIMTFNAKGKNTAEEMKATILIDEFAGIMFNYFNNPWRNTQK